MAKVQTAKDTRREDFPVGAKIKWVSKKKGNFKSGEVKGYHTWPKTGIVLIDQDGKRRSTIPPNIKVVPNKK